MLSLPTDKFSPEDMEEVTSEGIEILDCDGRVLPVADYEMVEVGNEEIPASYWEVTLAKEDEYFDVDKPQQYELN
jgi:hypothetical protein